MSGMDFLGGYLKTPSELGDAADASLREMEILSSTQYMLATAALDESLSTVIPIMTSVLQDSVSILDFASNEGIQTGSTFAHVSSSAAASATKAQLAVLASVSPYRRDMVASAIANSVIEAATVVTVNFIAGNFTALDEYIKGIDAASASLLAIVGVANNLNGLGQGVSDTAISSIASGVQAALDDRMHKLTMKAIAWETERDRRMAQESTGKGIGAIAGSLFMGAVDGYTNYKSKDKSAKTGTKGA